MADIKFPPVPPDVRDELAMILGDMCVDGDERWAFARGYGDGYGDGRRDQIDDRNARDAKEDQK